ncbi:unnamed protein product [Rotaria magnacalcarata]|uniref:NAD(P)(+)--arginine ADP-ribosyltransferase n=1 Tax=Rotaria magnacalcarata TaxID=392030 RepID=A0A816M925_9BILA|nr:unnamed protein product [Rotaria magnacalcarata]CAF4157015.1 unnamed protein product [Rotaria magnacalcarata]CAF4177881.1 unnamed protein product [Rotaria magnacalcarata]
MNYDSTAKNMFIKLCRGKLPSAEIRLVDIDDFTQTYNNAVAIYWYTKKCFLYKMMNRALRTQNIEVIMKIGFFVRDLHEQIKADCPLEEKSCNNFIVYRDQCMASNEFRKLAENVGGLFSVDSFLSTTSKKNQALAFIGKRMETQSSNEVLLLFKMQIDQTKSSVPFADIKKFSFFKQENEILFSMQTIFRVDSVQDNDGLYYVVNLTLTDEKDPILMKLQEHFEKQIKDDNEECDHLEQLGRLLIKMVGFDQAKDIFDQQLIDTDEDKWRERLLLNNRLGYIYRQKGNNTNALLYYNGALAIGLTNRSENDIFLAPIYNNIASVYYSKGFYSIALFNYKKALDIEQKYQFDGNHNLVKVWVWV